MTHHCVKREKKSQKRQTIKTAQKSEKVEKAIEVPFFVSHTQVFRVRACVRSPIVWVGLCCFLGARRDLKGGRGDMGVRFNGSPLPRAPNLPTHPPTHSITQFIRAFVRLVAGRRV